MIILKICRHAKPIHQTPKLSCSSIMFLKSTKQLNEPVNILQNVLITPKYTINTWFCFLILKNILSVDTYGLFGTHTLRQRASSECLNQLIHLDKWTLWRKKRFQWNHSLGNWKSDDILLPMTLPDLTHTFQFIDSLPISPLVQSAVVQEVQCMVHIESP